MTTFDWQKFLNDWSRAILASPHVEYYDLPAEAIAAGWLGFDGATEEQIAAAEARLSVTLPPSYRAFLKVSNGWRNTGTFINRILPVEEIYWLRDTPDPSLLEHIKLYTSQLEDVPFDPTYDQANYAHFNETLLIVEPTDEQELYLLNPQVKTTSGEWQAWAFGHWIPGVDASESFQALLEGEYRSVVEENQEEAGRITAQDGAQTIAAKLPQLIELLEDEIKNFRPAEDETRTDHPAYRYNQAMADGIQEVLAHVQALINTTPDPTALPDRLMTLAQEYEDKHRAALPGGNVVNEVMQGLSQITSPDDPNLAALTNRMMHISFQSSQTQGYMQAVSRIRFFLK